MKCVLVSGLSGGVGGTTVAANLAAALQSMGQATCCVDLDSANVLGLHFGVDPLAMDGWAARLAANGSPGDAAFMAADGRRVLPFGGDAEAEPDAILALVEGLARSPELNGQCRWLIVDVPYRLGSRAPALLQALGQFSDFELRVVDTSPSIYARLRRPGGDRLLPASAALLVNRVAPELKLASDMLLVYKHEYRQQMVPLHIHQDPSLPESLACLNAVMAYSPFSQAAADFRSLAIWLSAELVDQG